MNENNHTLDQFPEIMKGVAGDFAKLYSDYMESPQHFFYMSFLTCLGAVLSGRLTLKSEVTPQPRLFTLLLGESADDRKSTALIKTTDFFRETFEAEFRDCWGVGSAEGLQAKMKDSNRLLLCFDEFKQFVSKSKIKASALLPCVNTLFESNRYENRTAKGNFFIENAHLSVLAASTVQTYEGTWDSSFTDIGFNNRLFLVPGSGERKYSLPVEIPSDKKGELRNDVKRLHLKVGHELKLPISPAARGCYDDWYMTRDLSVHSKRLDAYCLRLMPLLAINEMKEEIDEATVEQVIKLADWQLRVRQIYDPIDADNTIAKMEEKMRRVLRSKGALREWQLKQLVNASRSGLWAFNAAIGNLIKASEVIAENGGKLLRLAPMES